MPRFLCLEFLPSSSTGLVLSLTVLHSCHTRQVPKHLSNAVFPITSPMLPVFFLWVFTAIRHVCFLCAPTRINSEGQEFLCDYILCPQFSRSLQPHGLQLTRPPCPSLTPRAYSNSCPWSQWCHPIISSSVLPFSSLLQSFPASGSFLMSQFFASSGLVFAEYKK